MASPNAIDDWSFIVTYICVKQSPFLYFFEPISDAQEHIFLVYGYDKSIDHIFIVDPLPYTYEENQQTGPFVTGHGLSTSAITFDAMFGGWGPERHTRDFVDICPEQVAIANGGSCPQVQ